MKLAHEGNQSGPAQEGALGDPTVPRTKAVTCRYHCVHCHRCFTSRDAFDEHIPDHGHHLHPEACTRLRIQATGRCDHSFETHPGGVNPHATLWEYHYVAASKAPRYQEETE